jgi:hypothetical protein
MVQCTACEIKGLECDNGVCCVHCFEHGTPCVRDSGTQYKIPMLADEIVEETVMALSDLAI